MCTNTCRVTGRMKFRPCSPASRTGSPRSHARADGFALVSIHRINVPPVERAVEVEAAGADGLGLVDVREMPLPRLFGALPWQAKRGKELEEFADEQRVLRGAASTRRAA